MVCRLTSTDPINSDDSWTSLNWSEEITFSNEKRWRPRTLQELVEVVARATEQNKELRAIGSCWSFEDIATSADWVVALDDLDKPCSYILDANPPVLTTFWQEQTSRPIPDPTADFIPRRLVHVEAGIRIAALSTLLESRGLSLPVLGGSNGQRLAGALSTSTHGGEWREPPLPDLIRALHLVTHGGRELWIEPASAPITVGMTLPLPCADAEVVRDDDIFKAAIVACGRFGVIYSVVLEVVENFRVAEDTSMQRHEDVIQALRDGIRSGTLIFQPLFDLVKRTPPTLPDAVGAEPRFFQIFINSLRPGSMWVTRRFVTTNTTDSPATAPVTTTGTTVTAEEDLRPFIVTTANEALTLASVIAGGVPLAGVVLAGLINGIQIDMNKRIADNPFTLGNVLAACLIALWNAQLGETIKLINDAVLGGRMGSYVRRGAFHVITSGTARDSDEQPLKSASIEVVFDATQDFYLAFLEDICNAGPRFRQAGYISMRPSFRSEAFLSMQAVPGAFAMSIEVASVQGLPDNDAWMRYVHDRALLFKGRPHWGQYNKMTALDVAYTYHTGLNRWREALLRVSGTSNVFSNNFCRTRGLEPTAIVREVTGSRRTRDGVLTHICNAGQPWSPVSAAQAIQDIQAGVVKYFVRSGTRLVPIRVVGGSYLRTAPNDTVADNLDSLPSC